MSQVWVLCLFQFRICCLHGTYIEPWLFSYHVYIIQVSFLCHFCANWVISLVEDEPNPLCWISFSPTYTEWKTRVTVEFILRITAVGLSLSFWRVGHHPFVHQDIFVLVTNCYMTWLEDAPVQLKTVMCSLLLHQVCKGAAREGIEFALRMDIRSHPRGY